MGRTLAITTAALTACVFCLCLLDSCGGAYAVGTPQITFSQTAVVFGTQAVGTTSNPQSFTLTNAGTGTLKISAITVSAGYGQTNTCGSTLAAGSSCDITVTFTPLVSGSATGTVSISDNVTGSPQTVSLTGTGGTSTGLCTVKGQQCPPQFPPCCSGLTCTPASTRAFCE